MVPELPEVETVRRQIQPLVSGMAILDGWSHPSAKFASAPDAVGHRISGRSLRALAADGSWWSTWG